MGRSLTLRNKMKEEIKLICSIGQGLFEMENDVNRNKEEILNDVLFQIEETLVCSNELIDFIAIAYGKDLTEAHNMYVPKEKTIDLSTCYSFVKNSMMLAINLCLIEFDNEVDFGIIIVSTIIDCLSSVKTYLSNKNFSNKT